MFEQCVHPFKQRFSWDLRWSKETRKINSKYIEMIVFKHFLYIFSDICLSILLLILCCLIETCYIFLWFDGRIITFASSIIRLLIIVWWRIFYKWCCSLEKKIKILQSIKKRKMKVKLGIYISNHQLRWFKIIKVNCLFALEYA